MKEHILEDGDSLIILKRNGRIFSHTPTATDEEIDKGVTPLNTALAVAIAHRIGKDKAFVDEMVEYAKEMVEEKKRNIVFH